jgi:hypothetical protein
VDETVRRAFVYAALWRFVGISQTDRFPAMSNAEMAEMVIARMKEGGFWSWHLPSFIGDLSSWVDALHKNPSWHVKVNALRKYLKHSVPLPPPEDIETLAAILLLKEKLWSRKKVKRADSSASEKDAGGRGGGCSPA